MMLNDRGFRIVAFVILLASCTTDPVLTQRQQGVVSKQDLFVGTILARKFEKHLVARVHPQVKKYLNSILESLTQSIPEFQGLKSEVFILKDFEAQWRGYSLPGNQIYLSRGLLRKLNYENEIAAFISLELAHLLNNDAPRQASDLFNRSNAVLKDRSATHDEPTHDWESLLQKSGIPGMPGIDDSYYFGPSGVFSFSEQFELEAIEKAVDILYRAGYDSRGIVSFLQILAKNEERSPFSKQSIDRYIEKARHEIASFAPIRNPIVSTQQFLMIQKRMKDL
jgi:predicted Zn-dependent protease